MIAYIDMPLRGTSLINGHDVLVIGLFVPLVAVGPGPNAVPAISGPVKVVYVDQDGSMGEAALSEINVNWRFDDRSRKWVDVDTGEDLDDDGDGQN